MTFVPVVLLVCFAVGQAAHLFGPQVTRTHFTPDMSGFFDAEESNSDAQIIALRKVNQVAKNTQWAIESSYMTKHNSITHVFLRQIVNGLEVDNCEANVNVASSGAIISMGVSAFTDTIPEDEIFAVSPREALFRLSNHLRMNLPQDFSPKMSKDETMTASFLFDAPEISSTSVAAKLVYVKVAEHKLKLAWRVRVESDMPLQPYGYFIGLVDALDVGAELIGLSDEVSWFMPQEQAENLAMSANLFTNETDSVTVEEVAPSASYLVYGIPAMDPNFGERVVVGGLPDSNASPLGWFNQGNGRTFTNTRGNNVFAQDNPTGGTGWINNYRPECGTNFNCQFPIDLGQQPVTYKDASILNLFWWNNVVHDIFYLHGFDEVSGNAQENNLGRGGRENDAVQANAQDGAGFNNANMATPIDGSRGRMRMYLWNGITPMRDGDLDSGIIVHEYAHHISIRLTGGPLNSGCLGAGQSGGMGEGWGDFFATLFLQTRATTRAQQFPMGLYAARRGIRPFPYSTTREQNPQTFGILNQGPPYNAVHAIGSVWCQILFQVYWEMRDAHGFDPDWWYGTGGNNALLQDVTDGMKLQPCSPNFVQARDAILLADRQNYAGRHVCALWKGFAFRGLGTGAISRSTNSVTESFAIPPECN